MKAARKPERSVLWPVVRPSASNTTVFTAPIWRASSDTASSSGITASLNGKVTLTPAKPARARRGQQLGQRAAGQGVDVHQMVVADHADGREGVLVQRRRQRLLDIGADQADQDTVHAASPPPRKSWAMRGSARIVGAVRDAGLALFQHQAIVGDGQRRARVLLDQQDGDAAVAQRLQDANTSCTISGDKPIDGSSISISLGSSSRPRAISSSFCWPPDRVEA